MITVIIGSAVLIAMVVISIIELKATIDDVKILNSLFTHSQDSQNELIKDLNLLSADDILPSDFLLNYPLSDKQFKRMSKEISVDDFEKYLTS